jgi:large subunit ribosomal protein L17
MCFIELVDFNEAMLSISSASEAKTTRRSRRGSKKKSETIAEAHPKKVKATGKKETAVKKAKAKTEITEPSAKEPSSSDEKEK